MAKEDSPFWKAIIQAQKKHVELMQKAGLFDHREELKKMIHPALHPTYFPEKLEQPIDEPETHKEKLLKAKEVYQRLAREWHGEYFDFPTIWECADEMRFRTLQLEFNSYSDAYRFAVKHYTANGKPIKNIGSLENEFAKAKHKGRELKSETDQFK